MRVPGVTSISCDLPKYGYAAKGASVVLYRERDLRKDQFVVYADWTGGLYGSPTMCVTRCGGPVAAAWAVLNYLGREGYLRMADSAMTTDGHNPPNTSARANKSLKLTWLMTMAPESFPQRFISIAFDDGHVNVSFESC